VLSGRKRAQSQPIQLRESAVSLRQGSMSDVGNSAESSSAKPDERHFGVATVEADHGAYAVRAIQVRIDVDGLQLVEYSKHHLWML
jgi:hypothetical protein